MKTLIILRHAKAQPDAPNGDHQRNLTDRGQRDASAVGSMLGTLVGVPDAIVTSDANRALQTAQLAAEACGFDSSLTIEPAIYAAEVSTLIDIIRNLPDDLGCVVIVGHNPGFEDLITHLAPSDTESEHLPTAGFAHVELDVSSWRELTPARSRLVNRGAPPRKNARGLNRSSVTNFGSERFRARKNDRLLGRFLTFGGDGGSRTPVQRNSSKACYVRVSSFNFPIGSKVSTLPDR